MTLCQTKTVCLLAGLLGGGWLGCEVGLRGAEVGKEIAPGVRRVGTIENPKISESSGLVASRQYPGVFWTHNDGGGGKKQSLYAITREGRSISECLVVGILLWDWEDLAIDEQNRLYLGDVGNNEGKRREIAVHQVQEPDPKAGVLFLQAQRSWTLRYPGAHFDCESLFIWRDYGYVVSKVLKDARAQIFRFPLSASTGPVVLELVATTKVESPVTGADLSPDGRLLALVAKSGAFVYRVEGDMARAGKGKPYQTKFRHEHIESCAFMPEGLLATAESREIYLFTDGPFHWKKTEQADGEPAR